MDDWFDDRGADIVEAAEKALREAEKLKESVEQTAKRAAALAKNAAKATEE